LSLKQSLALGGTLNLFAFWNGSAGPLLFAWPENGGLHAYQVGAGTLTAEGTNTEQQPGHPGGVFTVSSNGTMPGTGIVWATVPVVGDAWHATATGALYAFDASVITKPSLWNSNLNAQDNLGTFAKFSPPVVANGKVYVATFSGALRVYGLK
jgi:outer membrane protein assembly factor BamB